MSQKKVYLAIDLGAGSGRVLAGEFDGRRIDLVEVKRFDNIPLKLPSGWHWNISGLFQNIIDGLKLAAEKYGDRIESIGVDTWGVDYGLLDKDGRLLGLPFQYRDSRTDGTMEKLFERVPKEEIYRRTGIQFMFFNTINQLLAEKISASAALDLADSLLFLPDLLGYWLTGKAVTERSIASTSQLYSPMTHDWDRELIERLGIPSRIFKEIVDPGTPLGPLTEELKEATRITQAQVITVAGHDTSNAVAAIPNDGERNPAYLSSGTWSLMGLELDHPEISDSSCADGFTNEIGVDGKVRFLTNICGLWLIQESRRCWLADGIDIPYSKLASLAADATPFRSLINPDDPLFAGGGNIPEKIQDYCRRTKQAVPERRREIVRAIYESLALRYAQVWEKLMRYVEAPPRVLHIVGGGCQDRLLNQMAADAIGVTVLAGPVEATGLGNITTQAIALGHIAGLKASRKIITESAMIENFEPQDQDAWIAHKQRFADLTARNL